jgi:hypothetical protein
MSDMEKSEEGPQMGGIKNFFCDHEMNEEGRPITDTSALLGSELRIFTIGFELVKALDTSQAYL